MPTISICDPAGNIRLDSAAIVFSTMLYPDDAVAREQHVARALANSNLGRAMAPWDAATFFKLILASDKSPNEGGKSRPSQYGQYAADQMLMVLALTGSAPEHASRGKALFLLDSLSNKKAEPKKGIPLSSAKAAWASSKNVAHLWAALQIHGDFKSFEMFGYSIFHDFINFLGVAWKLQHFAQTHCAPPARSTAKPLIDPNEIWALPPNINWPEWNEDWPPFAPVYAPRVPDNLLTQLKNYQVEQRYKD